MGTTTNRALPYPAPSDLVTNGAAAMQALADAVDTQLEADVAKFAGNETMFRGPVPAAGTKKVVREGIVSVATTTSGGFFAIELGANGFANGIHTLFLTVVVATIADPARQVMVTQQYGDLDTLAGYAFNGSGAAVPTGTTVTVSYRATGY